jgi:hypothetical protein
MQRSAQRPGLDERAVIPERGANVLLGNAVHARADRELRGCLHLRVDAADVPDDLDQLCRAGTPR